MQIITNFTSSMTKFLDDRQKWASLAALQANDSVYMPDGFQVYCANEQAWYQLSTTDEKDFSKYTWSPIGADAGNISYDNTESGLEATDMQDAVDELAGISYTVVKFTGQDAGDYAAVYKLQKLSALEDPDDPGYTPTYVGEAINIPKDMVVSAGEVKTLTDQDTPIPGIAIGEKYIDLTLANSNNSHVYIRVADLVDDQATAINYSIDASTTTTVAAVLDDLRAKCANLDADGDITSAHVVVGTHTEEEGGETVTVKDTLAALITALNNKTANLDANGKLAAEHVTYSNTDAPAAVEDADAALDDLYTRTIATEGNIRKIAAGEPLKPEFSFASSQTSYLNAVGTTVTAPVFTITNTEVGIATASTFSVSATFTTGGTPTEVGPATFTNNVATITAPADITADTTVTIVVSYKFPGDTSFRTITKTFSYTFVSPSYVGTVAESADLTDDTVITALTSVVKSSKAYSYTGITGTNKKVVYAYPKSFGAISSIKDENNFSVTDAFNLTTELTIGGVAYYIVNSKATMTLSGGSLIFS